MANGALTSGSYDHKPFPDVSGLRSSASGRNGHLLVSQTIDVRVLQDLDQVEKENDWYSGTVLCAAWGTLLAHYVSSEATDIAFVYRHSALLLQSRDLSNQSLRRLCALISDQIKQIQNENHTSVDPAELDVSINLEAEGAESMGEQDSLRLAVCSQERRLDIVAAARIHCDDSAKLQLAQYWALLTSFAEDLAKQRSDASPPLSLSRFPAHLKAGSNPFPQPIRLEDDACLEQERFEGQFERWSHKTPEAIALDFCYDLQSSPRRTSLTYAELNHRAALVRDLLLDSVPELLAPNDSDPIVALCLDKSPEMYVAQLGILKAHAAWCPIDPDWPETRKQALLEKSGASVVLTAGQEVSEAVRSILPRNMRQLRLDAIDWKSDTRNHQPAHYPTHRGTATQLAYKIWTSGTTGLPKGVGIEHKAAVQALRALQEAIPHNGPIKYLQFSAYVFDLSIMDCFYAWGLGGTICACPRELLLTDLSSVVNRFQATHTLLTPAVMAMTPRQNCPSLKVVINGGEKLTQVVADMWSVNCCLLNLYGPAEATLIAMQRRVPSDDRVKAPNIGVALPTVSCHALNSQGEPVLKGSIGQLALGGFQCARGYIGDTQKTADKFISHPQLGRVYMTGDLVRQLAEETFEYLGREDDQIKINGIRIETLEISAIIRSSHELIKDSETMALPIGGEDDVRIVNFSVLPGKESLAAEKSALRLDTHAAEVAKSLRAAAQQALPSYMVPSLFIVVSHFPRTSSSKIDRVALKKILAEVDIPDWEATISHNGMEGVADDGEVLPTQQEITIRSHVASLCSVEEGRIGRHTPLPSLGLDSIKAMMLARRLTQEGIVLSVVDIVRNSTIAALALRAVSQSEQSVDRLVEGRQFLADFDQRLRGPVARHLDVDSTDIESALPTTPLQQGMLAETLRSKDGNAYWLNRVFSVSSEFCATDLQQAWQIAFDTIPGCRTAFCEVSQLDLQEELPAFLGCTFVQVARRDARPIALLAASQLSQEQMLREAQRLSGLNPLSGRPPLAAVISEHTDCHRVLLRAHHSIYDATSLELLEDTLAALLQGRDGTPVIAEVGQVLPHILPLSPEESDDRLQCWKKALKDVPPQLQVDFPQLSGHAPDSSKSRAHQRVSTTLYGGWTNLFKTAKTLGTSARPIAQCAWATVLSAYLDSDWVILGDSISGRAVAPGLDNVFGPLHATLAVPIRVNSGKQRREMVDDVDEFHKSLLGYQHMPLNLIRRQLGVRADQTLFQSVFVFEAGAASETPRVLKHEQDLHLSVEHPLALEVFANGTEDLSLGVVYDSRVLTERHATCLLRQFEASLRLFCQDDDGPAQSMDDWDSSLLSITHTRGSPEIQAAIQTPAEDWLLNFAELHPQATALEFWTDFDHGTLPQAVTYESLASQARQLASMLVKRAPPQSVIAVCLPRSVETYIALLATQLSGNIYLPIDEYLPSDRKALLIADSQAAIILAHSATAAAFAGSGSTPLLLLDDGEFVKKCQSMPSSELPPRLPGHLSYILYTSGSTGKPKGCRLTRSNLSVAIEAFRLKFEQEVPDSFTNGARLLARSAEAFDVALLETFLPLRTGSTIVTAPRRAILDDLRRAMVISKATHAAVVPSLFYSAGKRIRPEDVPNLRALIVGGEQIPADIIDLWGNSDVCTLNAYGPTEATIGISMSRVLPTVTTSNIGPPFIGSRYAVMKEQDGKLVPALRGQAGELCIIGPQVGVGYLNGRDSSAFAVWKGQPLYRTGDLARLTMNDEALYLGRMDDSQVKIRGARLELKEIDAVLGIPGKLRAATIVVTRGLSAPKLVTFVARDALMPARAEALGKTCDIDQTQSSTTAELQEKSRRMLPGHMQPTSILALQYLPLAVVSGKIDVANLRTIYSELAQHEDLNGSNPQATSRPLTRTEETLAECFHACVPEMGSESTMALHPSSDLFAAGLDSLSAISLAGRLKRSGLHISVLDLMAHPTLEAAAKACRSSAEMRTRGSVDAQAVCQNLMTRAEQCGVSMTAVEVILPCTPMQIALIGQTVGSEQALYVSRIDVALHQGIDPRRLTEAFDATVVANTIWRTSFAEIDQQFVQIVHAPRSKEYWSDSGSHSHTVADIVGHISDIPPVRGRLHCDHSERLTLQLLVHHALYDGVSLGLFLREVERRYLGQAVPSTNVTFGEAVLAIHAQSAMEAQNFWQKNLDAFPVTPFPSLHSERLDTSDERTEVTHQCTVTSASLSSAARRMGATPQSVLVSAFSSLYSQYTGEQDSLFGLVLSGRNSGIEGADQLQGPLVSTVPFRTNKLDRNTQATDAQVHAVHSTLLEIYRYQHTSLSQIGKWVKAEQGLFNTLFTFLPQDAEASVLFENIESEMETEFSLAIEVEPRKDGSLLFRAVFDPNLLPIAHAKLLLQQLEDEVSRFIDRTAPTKVGEADDQNPTFSICNPHARYPIPKEHFIALFQKQVSSSQQAVAIDFAVDGLDSRFQSLTYEQLDQASGILAARILERMPGPIVAVHMQRSIDFYVTILAVWKAGKTYMPLDPALPLERLQYMLECARTRFVITDAACRHTASQLSDDVVCFDDVAVTGSAVLMSASHPILDLSSIAYILFTSGSTGKPKGVPVTHRALSAAILSWKAILPHSTSSRMLQLASASFDVSLIEICMPLALGFAIASAPKDVLLEDLEDTFRKLRLTMADLPAALATTVYPENVPKLEWLMSGGDAIDERVLKVWAPHGLINAWGPTEATIGNTLGFVTSKSKRSLVGQVYPGSSIYVLEPETTNLVLRGCIGELAVGGPQVAEGYLGRGDLTEVSFFNLADGTPVYRTGDRGRILVNGNVEVLGRISRGQVKLRGQRLELDEISAALRSHSQVEDADTLYVQHPNLPSKQLVSWVSLKGAPQTDRSLVRHNATDEASHTTRLALAHLQRLLPSYMTPDHILVTVSALPLTPNNKVDHFALESAFKSLALSALHSIETAPSQAKDQDSWSETELAIRKTVAAFCGVHEEQVQRTTSFYRLGIDSISALRLAQALREAGWPRLSVRDIMRWSSVGMLAANAVARSQQQQENDQRKHNSNGAHLGSFDASEWKLNSDDAIKSVLPCTPLQSGMLSQTIASNGQLYYLHHPMVVRNTTMDRLRKAWASLIASRDILRTTFHKLADSDTWVQVEHLTSAGAFDCRPSMNPAALWHCALEDPTQHPSQFLSKQSYRLMASEHQGQIAIVLSIHHALYDGNTISLLWDDLDASLRGAQLSKRIGFSALVPFLLPDESDTEHWVKRLGNHQQCSLPDSAHDGPASAQSQATIPMTTQAARVKAQNLEVGLRTVALLAFLRTLGSLKQTRDVTTGEIFALRDVGVGAEDALGPVFNTVVTRVVLDHDVTVARLLKQMQDDSDEGRPHRRASLQAVQSSLGLLMPPFDTLFDYHVQGTATDFHHLLAQPVEAAPVIQYGLNVEFRQTEDTMHITATALQAHLKSFRLQDLVNAIGTTFVSILTDAACKVDELAADWPLPSEGTIGASLEQELTNGMQWKEDESLLQQIVTDILGIDRADVALDRPLASLGVDSIIVLRIASLARKRGLTLTISDLVEGRTISGTVKRAKTELSKTSAARDVPENVPNEVQQAVRRRLRVCEGSIETTLPALPGQVFQLVKWLNCGKRTGIFSWVLESSVPLDRERLQVTWEELRRHHSILRTTFATANGHVYQVVLREEDSGSSRSVEFTVAEDLRLAGRQTLRRLAASPQNLETPPSSLHVVTNESASLLILNISHALYDAWSIERILSDLERIYAGNNIPQKSSFGSFVRSIRGASKSNQGEGFWQAELQDADATTLLPPIEHPKERSVLVVEPDAFASVAEYQALQRHSTAQYLPPLQYLFIAAWSVELAALSGNARPIFGLYHSGRVSDHAEAHEVPGPTLNVLPTAGPANAAHMSLCDVAAAIERAASSQMSHVQTELAQICHWLDHTDAPLFDTYVNVIWNAAQVKGAAAKEKRSSDAASWSRQDLGPPSDFAPPDSISCMTSIDDLAPAYLRTIGVALDIDVVLREDQRHVGIGISSAFMNEAALGRLIHNLSSRVEGEVQRLKTKEQTQM